MIQICIRFEKEIFEESPTKVRVTRYVEKVW
jgi:hypothetical protein